MTAPVVSGRYRRLPALRGGGETLGYLASSNYDAAKEERCAESTGHVLVVLGDRIECSACGARWSDFGY